MHPNDSSESQTIQIAKGLSDVESMMARHERLIHAVIGQIAWSKTALFRPE